MMLAATRPFFTLEKAQDGHVILKYCKAQESFPHGSHIRPDEYLCSSRDRERKRKKLPQKLLLQYYGRVASLKHLKAEEAIRKLVACIFELQLLIDTFISRHIKDTFFDVLLTLMHSLHTRIKSCKMSFSQKFINPKLTFSKYKKSKRDAIEIDAHESKVSKCHYLKNSKLAISKWKMSKRRILEVFSLVNLLQFISTYIMLRKKY